MTPPWGVVDVVVRRGPTLALDGVTLDAPAGRVTAVVGGDGAGKTTLLRTLVGAIRPVRGEACHPELMRTGFVPATSGAWVDLTVDENIEFAASTYRVGRAVLRERREAVLDATGLAQAHDRRAGDLSGGMRQKLAFALATLHRPDLLVLDEPTTGVDPVSRVELWRLVSRAAADGTAVVLATTYLDEAARAGHVLVLSEGQPLLDGPPDEVLLQVPGTVVRTSDSSALSWRRGHERHAWVPDGEEAVGSTPIVCDLEDAVIATALAKEVGRA
jgi:ABC-2 type transport system ATP-binding protein